VNAPHQIADLQARDGDFPVWRRDRRVGRVAHAPARRTLRGREAAHEHARTTHGAAQLASGAFRIIAASRGEPTHPRAAVDGLIATPARAIATGTGTDRALATALARQIAVATWFRLLDATWDARITDKQGAATDRQRTTLGQLHVVARADGFAPRTIRGGARRGRAQGPPVRIHAHAFLRAGDRPFDRGTVRVARAVSQEGPGLARGLGRRR